MLNSELWGASSAIESFNPLIFYKKSIPHTPPDLLYSLTLIIFEFTYQKPLPAGTMSAGNRFNFILVFFVALGSFTYGFNSALIGSVLGLPSFLNYFDLNETGPDASRATSLTGGRPRLSL